MKSKNFKHRNLLKYQFVRTRERLIKLSIELGKYPKNKQIGSTPDENHSNWIITPRTFKNSPEGDAIKVVLAALYYIKRHIKTRPTEVTKSNHGPRKL